MRVLFAGSPDIAVPTLLTVAQRHMVVGILTNPESARGRGKEILPTAVALSAREHFGSELPILAPEKLDGTSREAVAALAPDILVVFAYGRIFGPQFLALFPKGGINIHPSLLPRHRGSSPIQQAILDRDGETGVSVQRIALEMDSGEIFAAEKIALEGRETAGSLSERCSTIGARLAASVLDAMDAGRALASPQVGSPSYCRKIAKEDGLIDWSLSSLDIDARVRAFDPWPGACSYLEGQRLNIHEAQPCVEPEDKALLNTPAGTIIGLDKARGIIVKTGEGFIALRKLQFAARKVLSYKDFANGMRKLEGLRFESAP
ncbi:MAG: methionyl-tRNA formyltransferase [Spirochaetae bacterium HGW-Spirochaetae-9]|nr:MAG: methionyl-tRNA formyltransferase [Spirochaetae bacterium HGW-Spirochaetae-9]